MADSLVAFKFLVLGILALVLISLGKALFHLTSTPQDDGKKLIRALTWRIGLSVALFLLLIIAYYKGWIYPRADAPRL
jgi:hypothetical protein